MSLNGALQVGQSAIIASQTALQVSGNNMANAATEGYNRRSIHFSPLGGETLGRGIFVGRGVQIGAIRREVDVALQARLRDAISQQQGAEIDQRFLISIESLQNELSENDLSSLLSVFFNSFSELANNPEDGAIRAVVVQEGRNLAGRIASLRQDYDVVRDEVDRALGAASDEVNEVLNQIAQVNLQIAQTEAGVGQANALRDQRDALIDRVAEFVDISTIEQPNGAADVFVGSIPIILAGESRGIELRKEPVDGALEVSIRVAADGTRLEVDSGQIGGLLRQRAETVEPFIESLDEFAGQLIFNVNRLHAQGQAQSGAASLIGEYAIDDTTANLNSVNAGLPYRVENGSFYIHVTHRETGLRTTHQINVDGDAMSLDDLIAEINTVVAVPNVTAGTGLGNRLTLDADPGFEISFSDDGRGALAALGVNSFFSGHDASNIDVQADLVADPSRLAIGAGHVPGSNDTALAIASLQDDSLDTLGGRSLREFWQGQVNDLAVRTDSALRAADSTALVKDSLAAQMQSVSGVSIDEEAINLLTHQRQFQAAARFISVIDEMIQTLLSLP
jgi:flagellar hook-associated protein 1 FlgK